MDIAKLLGDLKAERDQIVDAIGKLEVLAKGRIRGRGRPPAWRTMETAVPAARRRGRPAGSKNKARSPGEGAPPDTGAAGASGA